MHYQYPSSVSFIIQQFFQDLCRLIHIDLALSDEVLYVTDF